MLVKYPTGSPRSLQNDIGCQESPTCRPGSYAPETSAAQRRQEQDAPTKPPALNAAGHSVFERSMRSDLIRELGTGSPGRKRVKTRI